MAGKSKTELLASAIRKRQLGQKLTQKEQRAFDRFKREQDERLQLEALRAIPKVKWCEWSGRDRRQLQDVAARYGAPLWDRTIDASKVARWLHDLLAEHGPRLFAADSADEIWDGGATSPALERLREVQYEIKKRELALLDGKLLKRESVRKHLTHVAGILRRGGAALQQRFGPGALDAFNNLLDECGRASEEHFENEAAKEAERQPK